MNAVIIYSMMIEPVALCKNEFVIRDNGFANHGIEYGYIIKYDPDEVYFGDYQAVELDGVKYLQKRDFLSARPEAVHLC